MRTILTTCAVLMVSISFSTLHAQSKVEAAKPAEDEAKTEVKSAVQKPQKVSEMRKVVVNGSAQKKQEVETKEAIKYDEKGGALVPDKSKGIRQTQLTPSQKLKLDEMKKEQVRTKKVESRKESTSAPNKKDRE